MSPPPIVTGLSPNEGSQGTRITIRGEYFGSTPNDLIGLKICGIDCLLSAEWKSSTKIIAISGGCKGTGEVIITTRLGGTGTCNVTFKGYFEKTIGPLKESAVWVEEAPLFVWGRHALSPSSYQQEDPLGLSVEGNERKFPEDDLIELFPNGTGDITSENFIPGWFLLDSHHATSFNDLQAGLLHLRRKVDCQKEGQLSFLKSNICSVLDQLEIITVLDEKYRKDVQQCGVEPTLTLERTIKESEFEARKLFDDVLTRRDRADKTRNALNVLTRFRFLFCLPCVIERNIRKGDYDIVINDYVRVKNLFSKSDVPVFRLALVEIEHRIMQLQKMLHRQLTTMPTIPVEEQKKLIRHLMNLEPTSCEPAWDAINSHSEYIHRRMKECYDEHRRIEDQSTVDESRLKLPASTSKFGKFSTHMQDLQSVPECVLFVEELCQTVSLLFPDLWKLGQSYFTGELHVTIESGRQVEFKHIILAIMENFCKALRSAVIPRHSADRQREESEVYPPWWPPMVHDVLKSWLPVCLRHVRSTYAIFIKLDMPNEALDIVLNLIFDLRIHCMNVLFKQTTDQIALLVKQENWQVEFKKKHNGITDLPLKFQQCVEEVIQTIRESVVLSEQREGSLLDNPAAHAELDAQVNTLLDNFVNVLQTLAAKDEDGDCSPVLGKSFNDANTKLLLPSWERRLLTTLANCQYTRSTVLSNLEESFERSKYPLPKVAFRTCSEKLEALERTVLEYYLEEKTDPLVGIIEPSMYLENFDWDTKITPHDIRPYAKECISNLIHVHHEVNCISPALVLHVLPQVVQTIAEELYRLMICVNTFSRQGMQQACADISTLQEFFQSYLTPSGRNYFRIALAAIPNQQYADDKLRVDDIVLGCKQRMRLQLLSLQVKDGN